MRILLGVCGGIAAYKAAELVRALQQRGAEVEVCMTASAERFITPLTFNALTGKRVYTSLWSSDQAQLPEGPIEHIAVAQSIDALLVAPATANTLARFAHGLADDFLSTVYLATTAPVTVAPAMNVNMWRHPATEANLLTLKARGVSVVEPEPGYLACGMTGDGRLASVDAIVDTVLSPAASPPQDLAGETVLITAGGTREPIDPVRYLGNRSSGRMGHALAEAARSRGADVILVTASPLPDPAGTQVTRVSTAEEMGRALGAHLHRASIVIAAAAVADFRPFVTSAKKLRRTGPLTLQLEPTPDLLAHAAAHRRPGALVIGFAAESENLLENAREKLVRKKVDAIVANSIVEAGLGFESANNAGFFLTREEIVQLPPQPKQRMAHQVLDNVVHLLRDRPYNRTEAEDEYALPRA